MNRRATLTLVLVAVALVALVVFVEVPRGSPRVLNETPYPTTLPAIVALESTDIQRITLSRVADDTSVVLARDEEGSWQVMEPVTGPADATSMGALLGGLSRLAPTRRFEIGVLEPKAVGLDPAIILVGIDLADGESLDLRLGEDNPQGTACYAQVAGDQAVYLINRSLMTQALDMLETPPLEPTPTPVAAEEAGS